MSEGILFAIGFVVFIVVTVAVLMFAYARFNELYGIDRRAGGGPKVKTDGKLEYYAPSES